MIPALKGLMSRKAIENVIEYKEHVLNTLILKKDASFMVALTDSRNILPNDQSQQGIS